MESRSTVANHTADAAALGFYYQSFFALLTLLEHDTDNAVIGIEQLDDIELNANGQTLLYQLKHSIQAAPPVITLKSRSLWRTIKVWIDALPTITLSETIFHLVTVGTIPDGNPLIALAQPESDRTELADAMTKEAQHVIDARISAVKSKNPLPYSDRSDGCESFLAISATERLNLLRQTQIKHNSPNISAIEHLVASHLKLLPAAQRPMVAMRLVEWWDRQIIYALCDIRERFVSRVELQQQITTIVGDIAQDKLLPDFETMAQPEDYQPNGMLTRQIQLVEGKTSDISKAIREEWRARAQRSKWLNENPGKATMINEYDRVLEEHWADRHSQMVENTAGLASKDKCAAGLKILRWTHEEAPSMVRPIAQEWNAAYYIRGSYQVLAIDLKVGWHPDYVKLLGGGA